MKPKLNILSKDELHRVYLSILNVFEEKGVEMHSPQALKLLGKAGAEVDEKKRLAFIPQFMVEEAIKNAPKSVTLHGRNPKYRVKLEKDRSHLVLGSTTVNVIDPVTGDRVRGRKEFGAKAACMHFLRAQKFITKSSVTTNARAPRRGKRESQAYGNA